ncbi:unnamed protein product [Amoebophrya sp. A120]|nr:unnamed protein product [Amoebophrya sp. A120]|eukprot:GSA120T00013966001.1
MDVDDSYPGSFSFTSNRPVDSTSSNNNNLSLLKVTPGSLVFSAFQPCGPAAAASGTSSSTVSAAAAAPSNVFVSTAPKQQARTLILENVSEDAPIVDLGIAVVTNSDRYEILPSPVIKVLQPREKRKITVVCHAQAGVGHQGLSCQGKVQPQNGATSQSQPKKDILQFKTDYFTQKLFVFHDTASSGGTTSTNSTTSGGARTSLVRASSGSGSKPAEGLQQEQVDSNIHNDGAAVVFPDQVVEGREGKQVNYMTTSPPPPTNVINEAPHQHQEEVSFGNPETLVQEMEAMEDVALHGRHTTTRSRSVSPCTRPGTASATGAAQKSSSNHNLNNGNIKARSGSASRTPASSKITSALNHDKNNSMMFRTSSSSPRFQSEICQALRERVQMLERELEVCNNFGGAPIVKNGKMIINDRASSPGGIPPSSFPSTKQKKEYELEIINLNSEIEQLKQWKQYSVTIDSKLTELNSEWSEFVELRQQTDLKQMEIQNEKVLKILQLKDKEKEDLEFEKDKMKKLYEMKATELAKCEQRQQEMLLDLQELEKLRVAEKDFVLKQKEKMKQLDEEFHAEKIKIEEKTKKDAKESFDADLEKKKKQFSKKEQELTSEIERLKALNSNAGTEIQKLVREMGEKDDQIEKYLRGFRMEEAEAAVSKEQNIMSPLSPSKVIAAGSCSSISNAMLIEEQTKLKEEVSRLKLALEKSQEDLAASERLLEKQFLEMDKKEEAIQGGAERTTEVVTESAVLKRNQKDEPSQEHTTNSGTIADLKQIASLKSELSKSESAKETLEQTVAELEQKLSEIKSDKLFVKEKLDVFETKQSSACSTETQTPDTFWKEVETLREKSIQSLAYEFQLERTSLEQTITDLRLDLTALTASFEKKLHDAENDLKSQQKETELINLDFKQLQEQAELDFQENQDAKELLEEKQNQLQQELKHVLEQTAEKEKSFMAEKVKLQEENRKFEAKLRERHGQLCEALASLEAATNVAGIIRSSSSSGGPASAALAGPVVRNAAGTNNNNSMTAEEKKQEQDNSLQTPTMDLRGGGGNATYEDENNVEMNLLNFENNTDCSANYGAPAGATAVGGLVLQQASLEHQQYQLGDLLRRLSELTAKNLAFTKKQLTQDLELTQLKDEYEKKVTILTVEAESAKKAKSDLRLFQAREETTTKQTVKSLRKEISELKKELKKSEQLKKKNWRERIHSLEETQKWRTIVERERLEREADRKKFVRELREERERLEAENSFFRNLITNCEADTTSMTPAGHIQTEITSSQARPPAGAATPLPSSWTSSGTLKHLEQAMTAGAEQLHAGQHVFFSPYASLPPIQEDDMNHLNQQEPGNMAATLSSGNLSNTGAGAVDQSMMSQISAVDCSSANSSVMSTDSNFQPAGGINASRTTTAAAVSNSNTKGHLAAASKKPPPAPRGPPPASASSSSVSRSRASSRTGTGTGAGTTGVNSKRVTSTTSSNPGASSLNNSRTGSPSKVVVNVATSTQHNSGTPQQLQQQRPTVVAQQQPHLTAPVGLTSVVHRAAGAGPHVPVVMSSRKTDAATTQVETLLREVRNVLKHVVTTANTGTTSACSTSTTGTADNSSGSSGANNTTSTVVDPCVEKVTTMYVNLVKKFFISEKQRVWAELRHDRVRNQLAEKAVGGVVAGVSSSAAQRAEATAPSLLPPVVQMKNETAKGTAAVAMPMGEKTAENKLSSEQLLDPAPNAADFHVAINELEKSLAEKSRVLEALKQNSFLLEANLSDKTLQLEMEREKAEGLNRELVVLKTGMNKEMEEAKQKMEESVMVKLGGWKEALLEKVVDFAMISGSGPLGMNNANAQNDHRHLQTSIPANPRTKDTISTKASPTAECSPADHTGTALQHGVASGTHQPASLQQAAHASLLQKHCWSLEIALQELSEELGKQKVLASTVFQQNAQLKAAIENTSHDSTTAMARDTTAMMGTNSATTLLQDNTKLTKSLTRLLSNIEDRSTTFLEQNIYETNPALKSRKCTELTAFNKKLESKLNDLQLKLDQKQLENTQLEAIIESKTSILEQKLKDKDLEAKQELDIAEQERRRLAENLQTNEQRLQEANRTNSEQEKMISNQHDEQKVLREKLLQLEFEKKDLQSEFEIETMKLKQHNCRSLTDLKQGQSEVVKKFENEKNELELLITDMRKEFFQLEQKCSTLQDENVILQNLVTQLKESSSGSSSSSVEVNVGMTNAIDREHNTWDLSYSSAGGGAEGSHGGERTLDELPSSHFLRPPSYRHYTLDSTTGDVGEMSSEFFAEDRQNYTKRSTSAGASLKRGKTSTAGHKKGKKSKTSTKAVAGVGASSANKRSRSSDHHVASISRAGRTRSTSSKRARFEDDENNSDRVGLPNFPSARSQLGQQEGTQGTDKHQHLRLYTARDHMLRSSISRTKTRENQECQTEVTGLLHRGAAATGAAYFSPTHSDLALDQYLQQIETGELYLQNSKLFIDPVEHQQIILKLQKRLKKFETEKTENEKQHEQSTMENEKEQQELFSRLETLLTAQKQLQGKYFKLKDSKKQLQERVAELEENAKLNQMLLENDKQEREMEREELEERLRREISMRINNADVGGGAVSTVNNQHKNQTSYNVGEVDEFHPGFEPIPLITEGEQQRHRGQLQVPTLCPSPGAESVCVDDAKRQLEAVLEISDYNIQDDAEIAAVEGAHGPTAAGVGVPSATLFGGSAHDLNDAQLALDVDITSKMKRVVVKNTTKKLEIAHLPPVLLAPDLQVENKKPISNTSDSGTQVEAKKLQLSLRPAGDLSSVISIFPDPDFALKQKAIEEFEFDISGKRTTSAEPGCTAAGEGLQQLPGAPERAQQGGNIQVVGVSDSAHQHHKVQGATTASTVPQQGEILAMTTSKITAQHKDPPSLAEVNGLLYDVQLEKKKCDTNSTLRLELEALRYDHSCNLDARKRLEHERGVLLRELASVQEERSKVLASIGAGDSQHQTVVTQKLAMPGVQHLAAAAAPAGGATTAPALVDSTETVVDSQQGATLPHGAAAPSSAHLVLSARGGGTSSNVKVITEEQEQSRLRKHNEELRQLLASSQNRFEELRQICESSEELQVQLKNAANRENVLTNQLEIALNEQTVLREELRLKSEEMMELRYRVLEYEEAFLEGKKIGYFNFRPVGRELQAHINGRKRSRSLNGGTTGSSGKTKNANNSSSRKRNSSGPSAVRQRSNSRSPVKEHQSKLQRTTRGELQDPDSTNYAEMSNMQNSAKKASKAAAQHAASVKRLRQQVSREKERADQLKQKNEQLQSERDLLAERQKDMANSLKLGKAELECKKQLLLSLQSKEQNGATGAGENTATGSGQGQHPADATEAASSVQSQLKAVEEKSAKLEEKVQKQIKELKNKEELLRSWKEKEKSAAEKVTDLARKLSTEEEKSKRFKSEVDRKEQMLKGKVAQMEKLNEEAEQVKQKLAEKQKQVAKLQEEGVKLRNLLTAAVESPGGIDSEVLVSSKLLTKTSSSRGGATTSDHHLPGPGGQLLQGTVLSSARGVAGGPQNMAGVVSAKLGSKSGGGDAVTEEKIMQTLVKMNLVVPSSASSPAATSGAMPMPQPQMHTGAAGTFTTAAPEAPASARTGNNSNASYTATAQMTQQPDSQSQHDIEMRSPSRSLSASRRSRVVFNNSAKTTSTTTTSAEQQQSQDQTRRDLSRSRSPATQRLQLGGTRGHQKNPNVLSARNERSRASAAQELFAEMEVEEDDDELIPAKVVVPASARTRQEDNYSREESGQYVVRSGSSYQSGQGGPPSTSTATTNHNTTSNALTSSRPGLRLDNEDSSREHEQNPMLSESHSTVRFSRDNNFVENINLRTSNSSTSQRQSRESSSKANNKQTNSRENSSKLLTESEELFGKSFNLRDRLSDKMKLDAAVLDSLSILNLTLEDVPAFLGGSGGGHDNRGTNGNSAMNHTGSSSSLEYSRDE